MNVRSGSGIKNFNVPVDILRRVGFLVSILSKLVWKFMRIYPTMFILVGRSATSKFLKYFLIDWGVLE